GESWRASGSAAGVNAAAHLIFVAFALGDIRHDHHETAAGHRNLLDFDYPPIGPHTLVCTISTGFRDAVAYLLLRVVLRTILAALGEVTDIIGERWPRGQHAIG